MEYRLFLGDDNKIIANVDPSEVSQLTWALGKSTVIDKNGKSWRTGDSPTLYFDVQDSYFYLSLDEE